MFKAFPEDVGTDIHYIESHSESLYLLVMHDPNFDMLTSPFFVRSCELCVLRNSSWIRYIDALRPGIGHLWLRLWAKQAQDVTCHGMRGLA